jgi:hypothetical protein
MAILKKLKSAARGVLWIVRPSGLHHSMDHGFAHSLARFEGLMEYYLRTGIKEQKRQINRAGWREIGDLRAYERTVFSQNGEDGIIEEILRRIGVTNKFFVEFGVEWGEVCNCARLVVEEQWQGLFIEANRKHFDKLVERYRPYKNIQCANEYVNSTTIQKILAEHGVPKELDLLSIDIDGNDYWVWKSIEDWRPRLLVIEYNPTKGPNQLWVMAENPNHIWDGTNYFGASLASLKKLSEKKGYTLVATDSRGVNAFFVRDDLVGEGKFLDPVLHYHFSELNHPLLPYGVPEKDGPYLEI